MTHVPHQLNQDFPDKTDVIHKLKQEDAHFVRLADEYHEVNNTIHKAETNVEPVDDIYMATLRKKRMSLKDEISKMLNGAADV